VPHRPTGGSSHRPHGGRTELSVADPRPPSGACTASADFLSSTTSSAPSAGTNACSFAPQKKKKKAPSRPARGPYLIKWYRALGVDMRESIADRELRWATGMPRSSISATVASARPNPRTKTPRWRNPAQGRSLSGVTYLNAAERRDLRRRWLSGPATSASSTTRATADHRTA